MSECIELAKFFQSTHHETPEPCVNSPTIDPELPVSCNLRPEIEVADVYKLLFLSIKPFFLFFTPRS
jgi:hypothetical protein